MAKAQYGIIKVKKPEPEFEPRSLLRVPHKQGDLVVGYPTFGPNYFNMNVAEMQKSYSHPQTGARISFREPTTAESISAAAYDFKNLTKPQIFDLRWLQIGRIVRTLEGIFANVPRDVQGNLITDEQTLKSFLKEVKSIKISKGKIYIVPDAGNLRDFGYAPYETFNQGVQDAGDFAESGLARVLEHTEKTALKLKKIASKKNYPIGVNVMGFNSVERPALKVANASLYSGGYLGRRLIVGGDCMDVIGRCAFGVLDSTEGTCKKIKQEDIFNK